MESLARRRSSLTHSGQDHGPAAAAPTRPEWTMNLEKLVRTTHASQRSAALNKLVHEGIVPDEIGMIRRLVLELLKLEEVDLLAAFLDNVRLAGYSLPCNADQINAFKLALPADASVDTLVFNSGQLGDPEITAMKSLLGKASGISDLTFKHVYVSQDKARKLYKALQEHTTIGSLSLHLLHGCTQRGLGDLICGVLARPVGLKQLRVWFESGKNKHLARIAEAALLQPQLTSLQLAGCATTDMSAHIAKHLRKNTTLKVLELKQSEIGRAGCKSLTAALSENTTLHELSLIACKITGNGDMQLQDLVLHGGLRTLKLENLSEVPDANLAPMMKALQFNTNLECLSMSETKLNMQSASDLAEALTTNTSLTHLYVGAIPMESLETLASSIKVNKNLLVLGGSVAQFRAQ